ncbi:MAG TPA: alcohol dehydrogenase catalytic domain-containing protein [Armatimonadota bacterium]|jgi:threonine dehydrogenase-like Zn-dependent dehydrogenase
MRALLRVGPGEAEVVERATPEPGPGEVRVRISACGICGSDLARLRDEDPKWNRVVLGHECSGVVDAVGEALPSGTGVSPVVGQRVALVPLAPDFTCPYCRRGEFSLCDGYSFFGSRRDGGLAEYLVAPAVNFLPVPDAVDDEAAAMLEPLSVATKACLLGGMSPARQASEQRTGVCGSAALRQTRPYAETPSVLVMGAGAIGLLAVEVALALGADPVIACDVVPEKLALAEALGAQTVLSDANSAARVREITGGGADICLECSGHWAAFAPALESLGKGGTLVLVGTGPREVTLSGEQREQLCRRMLTVRGQWMSYGPTWPGEPWTLPLELMAAGRIDPLRLITHRYALEQGPEAVRMMLAPGADFLKVMINNE